MTDKAQQKSLSQLLVSAGERVASGNHADVWLVDEALEKYRALEKRNDDDARKAKTQLPRFFKRYADGHRLSDQQFKPQGEKTVGYVTMQVFAFKGRQFRIYGVVVDCGGQRTFIGCSVDPSKKQNSAKSAIVKRAVEIYVRMFK
ncbi:hypothetical protein [Aliihoeflea sp. PC F10.4]